MYIPFLHRAKPQFDVPPRPRFSGLELHCRLLPFFGDGPFSANESLTLVQGAYELGFSHLLLTPPVMQGYYDLHPAQIRQSTQKLTTEARPDLPGLRLLAAATYYTDAGLVEKLIHDEEILSFSGDDLNQPLSRNALSASRLRPARAGVLLATSLVTLAPKWNPVVRLLQAQGRNPVLTQAERYVFLQQAPEQAQYLYQTGVRFQLDIASLTGTNGPAALKLANYLIDNQLVNFIGFYPAFDRFLSLLRQAITTDGFRAIAARR